jgi:hypothetical protein
MSPKSARRMGLLLAAVIFLLNGCPDSGTKITAKLTGRWAGCASFSGTAEVKDMSTTVSFEPGGTGVAIDGATSTGTIAAPGSSPKRNFTATGTLKGSSYEGCTLEVKGYLTGPASDGSYKGEGEWKVNCKGAVTGSGRWTIP